MDTDSDGGTHGEARRIDDGNRVVGAIADHDCRSVRRNAGQAGTSANMKRSRNAAMVKIKHRNIVRPGIGNVGAVSVGRNIDEERTPVNSYGRDHLISLRINHADIRRAGIDDINFVALWIGGNSSGLRANLQSSYGAETAEIDNRNRVALAIGYICEFSVERAITGESALVEVVPAGGQDERDEDSNKEKFSQNGEPW